MHIRPLLPVIAGGFALSAALPTISLTAQPLPLRPPGNSGQTVTPAFEGWYRNPDGTFSLSFGYYNRNTREVIDVPIGPSNLMEPGNQNQGQPTRFAAGRHWGVFAVKVPRNFGEKEVTWTLNFRGEKYVIPGSLKDGWELDALAGTITGNKPPLMRFEPNGPSGSGPGGITGPTLSARVGTPLSITLFVIDSGATPAAAGRAAAAGAGAARGGGGAARGDTGATGRGGAAGRAGAGRAGAAGAAGAAGRGAATGPTITWFVHQGTGQVTFAPPTGRPEAGTGRVATSVTFAEPGNFVIRARANEGAVASAGHAQCCWSNAFVNVTVTR